MLWHHWHQTWTFLLHINGCSSDIKWTLGLDINRTWLFLHHTVKRGCSYYTQWSLLCAPVVGLVETISDVVTFDTKNVIIGENREHFFYHSVRRKWMETFLSFILAGILYRKFMVFFALRKKLLRLGKILKTHAAPTPAHFKQNMPQKCQKKLP